MRKLIYLILILNYKICFSQFGIIQDSDGFVNIRNSPKIDNNIFDTLENGYVVFHFENEGNWINIDYKKNGEILNGYIYNDRIKYISEFINIPIKSNLNGNIHLENEVVKIEISEGFFEKEKHHLEFDNQNLLEKIDNFKIFGVDGNIPKKEYKSIKIEIAELTIKLPKIALKNLFEPNLNNSKANYDPKNEVLYISSSNSDGAGSYEVVWVIEKGKYKYRIEVYGF